MRVSRTSNAQVPTWKITCDTEELLNIASALHDAILGVEAWVVDKPQPGFTQPEWNASAAVRIAHLRNMRKVIGEAINPQGAST